MWDPYLRHGLYPYIFTLAHGFIPLLHTPLCVPPWAKRPMIAHTYHNKEWTVLGVRPMTHTPLFLDPRMVF